ncbi:hypothetical protein [Haloarcula salina]|uniref:Uncharacterized protein n=1 Tax=Haloarcula salina TaxID=1429914 RepID=A0AA41FWM2_9EURY|nr:hypothetical protein [Haloarcula salina]MBV0900167.1 hypothetical protein [Haloarcula salina]
MTDYINDLDAAVTGTDTTKTLAKEYPDASPQSLENAERIAGLTDAVSRLTDHLTQRKTNRDRRREMQRRVFAEIELEVARLAVATGKATEREKQLVREAAEADNANLDDLAKRFDPAATTETHQ